MIKSWHVIKAETIRELGEKVIKAANGTLCWMGHNDTYTDYGDPEIWKTFLQRANLKEIEAS